MKPSTFLALSACACAEAHRDGEHGATDGAADGATDDSGDSGRTPPFACSQNPSPAPAEWTLTSAPPGGDVQFVGSSPTDATRAAVGASTGGVLHSVDGGASWNEVFLGAPPPHAYSVPVEDPSDPDVVWISIGGPLYRIDLLTETAHEAGVGSSAPEEIVRAVAWLGGDLFAVDASANVWTSAGGTGAWSLAASLGSYLVVEEDEDDGDPHSRDNESDALDANSWFMFADGERLVAVRHGVGIYTSTDAETWVQVHDGDVPAPAVTADGGQIYFATGPTVYTLTDGGEPVIWAAIDDDVIAVEALDGRIAVASETSLWLGDAGGITQGPIDTGVALVMDLGFQTDGALLVGHDEGMVRLAAGAEAVTDASHGIEDTDAYSLLTHWACPSMVWAATGCMHGLYRSDDGGESWLLDPTHMHYVMAMANNPARAGEVWLTTDDKLLVTTDWGETWSNVAPDAVHFHGLAVDPFLPDTLLVGSVGSGVWADPSGRVWRSDDAGSTWKVSSTGLDAGEGSVHTLLFVPEWEGVVLAGTYKGGIMHNAGVGSGLFRSEDHGKSWAQVYAEVQGVPYLRSCNGHVYATTELGLARSDDAGLSWTVVLEYDLASGFGCFGDTILSYAASNGGILRSDDAGASWSDWSQGMGARAKEPVPDFAWSGDGRTVYVAMRGVGVFARAAD